MKAKKALSKHQPPEKRVKHRTPMVTSLDTAEDPVQPPSLEAAEDQLITREPMTSMP